MNFLNVMEEMVWRWLLSFFNVNAAMHCAVSFSKVDGR